METVKAYAQKQLTLVTTDPATFALNVLGSAVAIWFASMILNFAVRISMNSFAIITSDF